MSSPLPANLWTSACRGDGEEIMNYLEYYPRADINEQGTATMDDGSTKGIGVVPNEDSLLGIKFVLVDDTSLVATALHFAVICGHENAVQMLKKFDADIQKQALGCGVTPAWMAFVNGLYHLEDDIDPTVALNRQPFRKAIIKEHASRHRLFSDEANEYIELLATELINRCMEEIQSAEKNEWDVLLQAEDEQNPLKTLMRQREAAMWDFQMSCRAEVQDQEEIGWSVIVQCHNEPHVVVTTTLSQQGWRSDYKMYISRYTPYAEVVERLEKFFDQRLQISFVAKHKPTEAQQSRNRLLKMVQSLRDKGTKVPNNLPMMVQKKDVHPTKIQRWLQLDDNNVHIALSYNKPYLKALPRYPFLDLPPEKGARKKLNQALEFIPAYDERMGLMYDRMRRVYCELHGQDPDEEPRFRSPEDQTEAMERLYYRSVDLMRQRNQDWSDAMDEKIAKYANPVKDSVLRGELSPKTQSLVNKLHDESIEHKEIKMAELEETRLEGIPAPPEFDLTDQDEKDIVMRVYYGSMERKQKMLDDATEKVYGVPTPAKKLTKEGIQTLVERQYTKPTQKAKERKAKYAVKSEPQTCYSAGCR